MKKMIILLCVASLLLITAACKDEMAVQKDYVGARDECHEKADKQMGIYNSPDAYGTTDKEKKAANATIFCECMKDHEWKVSGCAKPAVVAAPVPAPKPVTPVVVAPVPVPAPAPTAAPAPVAPPAPPINNTTVLVVQPTPPVVAPTTVTPATPAPPVQVSPALTVKA